MAPLVSQPFRNEQEPGLLPELEIPAEIGGPDHRSFRSDIAGGIILPPGIEAAVPMELLQGMQKFVDCHSSDSMSFSHLSISPSRIFSCWAYSSASLVLVSRSC